MSSLPSRLSFAKNIFFYFFGIIFITIAFIGSFLFSIHRYFIGLYLSNKYGHPVEFVEGVDAVFCFDDEKTPYLNQMCHVFKGKANLEQIRRRVNKFWLAPHRPDGQWKHKKLRQELKFELGYYFWIFKHDFRPEDHVIEYDGSHIKTKDEYHQFIEQLGSNLTAEKRIIWQFVVIHLANGLPGVSTEPHFVFCCNMHHGLCDGISMIRLNMQLFDEDNFDPKLYQKRLLRSSFVDHLLHWSNVAIFGFYRFCQHLAVKPKLVSLGTGLTSSRVVSISDPIPFEKVKKIKLKTATTTNDVLTSCVLGAFRKHLLSENRPISEMVKLNIPINLNDLKNDVRLENKVSFLSLLLDVDVASPIDCLMRTKSGMDKLKQAPEMYIVHYIVKSIINTIPKYLTLPFVKRFFTTAVVSNAPTSFSGTLFGNEHQHTVPLGTPNSVSGCGIIIGMLSDNDTVTYAVKADTGVMKNQETLNRFVGFIVEHLDNLYRDTATVKS
uniref:O-acyltransferase WSD1 C-terminal domain-containing protein n=1 Tax=Strigamia maritima TaxID=126957 RepID=T1J8F8_STRMM